MDKYQTEINYKSKYGKYCKIILNFIIKEIQSKNIKYTSRLIAEKVEKYDGEIVKKNLILELI